MGGGGIMKKTMDPKEYEMFAQTIEFLDAQHEAEKRGEHEFTCPICGGIARWERAGENGHLHVGCVCGMRVCE